MRITWVLPHAGSSGGDRVVAIYAQRLARRGHEVSIVSGPTPLPSYRDSLKSLVKGRGWLRSRYTSRSHFDELDLPHYRVRESRPIEDRDVPDGDVVIATWWETAEWVAALSASKGVKAHLIQHYEIWGGPRQRVDNVWRLPLHRIVISAWLQDLARRFGDDRAVTVLNSVDTEQFHAPARGKQDRPTLGLLYSPLRFKGVDVAFEAIKLMRQRGTHPRVLALSHYKPEPPVPLIDGVEMWFRPPQHKIRELYAKCDLWLCGSRAEGFHLPPLEAMACRTPVVSTRVGGPLDTIADGENGFLVDVEDAPALAARAMDVLHMPEPRWRQMSDAALHTALRYTWDDATERLEAALGHAVTHGSDRTPALAMEAVPR